jgi:protein-histidine pros-kinase
MMQDVTLQKKLQREITEKQNAIHQTYQELLVQNKQLKELDVAKNRFIGMTTHELRTPLSAIVASAEILVMKLYDSPDQLDEFIKMIHDQGVHMMNLVNDILDFAKITSNKMDYYIEEHDLAPFIQHEIEGLQNMAEKSNITLNYEAPNEPTPCYYDDQRLRQVIANLVNNAIKYNKPQGQVSVHIETLPEVIKLSVKDTGKGIAEEDQAKVFNEFETLGKTANHSKGTGLGLPISLRMMQAMGGTLQLTSEVGVGSVFWIEIPRKQILSSENYRKRPDDTGDLAA